MQQSKSGLRVLILICIPLIISACTGIPESIEPVRQFDLNRYLGRWYEIARLDHSFERGLDRVTAEYSLRDDGGVKVINRGYSKSDKKWKEAEGKAYFVRSADEGYLKVSFFGPFYGSYIVFELDKKEYRYAFVSGPDKSYLWLLSRTPEVQGELIQDFKTKANTLGFDTSGLII
ncbi:MAG: lipocalin, partial [Gammaproteobacteria bacterium]